MHIDPAFASTALPMALGSMGLYLTFYLLHKKRPPPRPLEYVGTVKELYLHPLKSCRGVALEETECTWLGLKSSRTYDRQFIIADPSDADGNKQVNMKVQYKLALVSSEMNGDADQIQLSFPGMENLTLPKRFPADDANTTCTKYNEYYASVDCGDEAAEWINKALETKKPLRLFYVLNGMKDRSEAFQSEDGKLAAGDDQKLAPQFVLPEQSTVNLLSQASLEELNRRLAADVTIRHFRPNIVVEGCQPNDEDNWKEIVIGEASFFQFDFAERCFITTIDPENPEPGHYKKEPLATLRGYRKRAGYDGPLFGVRLGLSHEGSIKVGDEVFARRKP